MPFPPRSRRRRRCVLCGATELAELPHGGKFLLVPDPKGRGPVCPAARGCEDRQRQLALPGVAT
ncbi:MAG: hypothetical protein JNK82_09290 [Myxococcaceae bacterium]|nr:hypothetical protein [Myxococcaceae bacterium]